MVLSLCDCCNRDGYQQIGSPIRNDRLGKHLGVRHWQCFLVFCGLAVAYTLRVNLSVAIVAMTDRNATNPDFQEFNWDESVKSYLLSSFFWGYVITQIPGGYLAHKYGAKYTLFYGIFICSCLAVLTPFCAEVGDWPLVLALRSIQGLCQGVIFPSTHTFISKWAPVEERGRFVSFAYSGAQFGTVVMLSLSGYIASSWLGWPSIFYISGIFGILWALVWYYFCASSPAEHPTISLHERRFIENDILRGRRSSNDANSSARVLDKPPYTKMLSSIPFLTLILVHCANNWGFWTLMTEIPSYMKYVLGVDIRHNGPLSALPYACMWLLSYGNIFLSDYLNRRNLMSLSFSRKFFNTIGQWVPMVALTGLGYITAGEANVKLAIALLTIAIGANSATYLGSHVNHIDLSPNFAGSLMGITNCAANIISIIAPLAVGLIVTDETNPIQWRQVFFVSSFFYFIGNLLFILFGSTNIQNWNYVTSSPRRTNSSLHNDNDDADDENEEDA